MMRMLLTWLRQTTLHHIPVSYTHLDVYKRQGVDRINALAAAGYDNVAVQQLSLIHI